MTVRTFAAEDLLPVTQLYNDCHPRWPTRQGLLWYWAHPTLVLEEAGRVVGMTSMSFCLPPVQQLAHLAHDKEVCWGAGVEVEPSARGGGRGLALCEKRLEVARQLGCRYFFGMTAEGNKSMRAILERQGFKELARIPNAYPWDHEHGVLYGGGLD